MSLISEEERETLRRMSIEKLAEIIKEKRPWLPWKTALNYACCAKAGLRKGIFDILANGEMNSEDKVREIEERFDLELSPESIRLMRRSLIALGAIKKGKRQFNEEYAKQLGEPEREIYKVLCTSSRDELKNWIIVNRLLATDEIEVTFSENSLNSIVSKAILARDKLDRLLNPKLCLEEIIEKTGLSRAMVYHSRSALRLLFPELIPKRFPRRKRIPKHMPALPSRYRQTVVLSDYQIRVPTRQIAGVALYHKEDGHWEYFEIQDFPQASVPTHRYVRIPAPIVEHMGLKIGDEVGVIYFSRSLKLKKWY